MNVILPPDDSHRAKANGVPGRVNTRLLVGLALTLLGVIVACLAVWYFGDLGDSAQERRHGTEKHRLEQQFRADMKGLLTGEVLDKDETIAALRAALSEAQNENTQLKTGMATLSASIEGGYTSVERERALDAKERRVMALEAEFINRDATLKAREDAIRKLEFEFYESTKISREDIGEARALAKEHEYLKEMIDSERQANREMLEDVLETSNALPRWILTIGSLMALGLIAILIVVARGRNAQTRQIENLRTITIEAQSARQLDADE